MLTLAVLAAEVVGAVVSGSLALLADAGPHGHRRRRASRWPSARSPWPSAPPAAGARSAGSGSRSSPPSRNGLLLLLVAGYVLVEAVRRIGHPPEIGSGLMLAVAAVGLAVNLVSLAVLHRGRASR